jgi:regulator of PEP synthase PpsR (kinase-PPPase family)
MIIKRCIGFKHLGNWYGLSTLLDKTSRSSITIHNTNKPYIQSGEVLNSEFHIHLVSDSTGETVSSVARAAIAQFEHLTIHEHLWNLVRTGTQMDRVIDEISKKPGMVMFTLVDGKLREKLTNFCLSLRVPCVPVLATVLSEMKNYFGVKESNNPGRQHEMDDDYFKRVEAINFSLTHDDGQMTQDLEKSDIILVGVSRTSKSPTSIYLAFRGYKTANVPYVKHCPLPQNLFEIKSSLIVGLTIGAERLVDVRRNRLSSLNQNNETDYVDIDAVKDEIAESRRLYAKYGWPVIDVTRKSVEETAATILNLYHSDHQERIIKE